MEVVLKERPSPKDPLLPVQLDRKDLRGGGGGVSIQWKGASYVGTRSAQRVNQSPASLANG